MYASAGHPPALLRGSDGLRRLQCRNPPIGVVEGRSFAEERTTTRPDERLYLFSDGAFEITGRDGRSWELADFESLVRAPEQAGVTESERLRSAVQRSARDAVLEDDFSLLVLTFP